MNMFNRKKIRRHYVFEGDVQGVGFRWYAKQAASACGVTGWVRNEYDGSVTMELQGSAEQIDAALEMLKEDSWIRIIRTSVREIETDNAERSFRVRY